MRILLADDHAIVRTGFRRLLAETLIEPTFGEASNAAEAIEAVRASPWDLVVLDVSMPGMSGLDALVEIRALSPRVPVLMMTMYGEAEYAVRAFRCGASGFLTKGSPPEELIDAVRKLLAGGRFVSRSVAEHLAASLVTDANRPLHELLSNREFQVLRMLATGMTVKGIGHSLHLSDKTVSTYRTRVLDKMHMNTTAELIRYAHRSNLVD